MANVALGVDVGLARVGVAASDPSGILATPVMTLRRDVKKNSDRRMLLRIIADRGVTEVFVGSPNPWPETRLNPLKWHVTTQLPWRKKLQALISSLRFSWSTNA